MTPFSTAWICRKLRTVLPVALLLSQAIPNVFADYPMTDFEYAKELTSRIASEKLSPATEAKATTRYREAVEQNRSGSDVWPVFLCVEEDLLENDTLHVFWADPNGAGDVIEITTTDGKVHKIAIDHETRELNRFRASDVLPCRKQIDLGQILGTGENGIDPKGVRIVLEGDNPLTVGRTRIDREIARFLDRCRRQNSLLKGTPQEEDIDIEALTARMETLPKDEPETPTLIAAQYVGGPPPNPNVQVLWRTSDSPVLRITATPKNDKEVSFRIPPFLVSDQQEAIARGFKIMTRTFRTTFPIDGDFSEVEVQLSTSRKKDDVPVNPGDQHLAQLAEELKLVGSGDAPEYFLYLRVLDNPLQRAVLLPQFASCAERIANSAKMGDPIVCGYFSHPYSDAGEQLPVNIYWSARVPIIRKITINTSIGGKKTIDIDPTNNSIHRYYADFAWQMNDLGAKLLFFTVDFSFDDDPGEVLSITME